VSSNWSLTIPVIKADPIRGLVTGWAAISTDDTWTPVVDHDGEVLPIYELEKAAHAAFTEASGSGKAGDMHARQGVADVVESFVLDKAKRVALGFGDPQPGHPAEGWIVTLKLRDPRLIEDVAAGRKLELSIKGRGRRIGFADWQSSQGEIAKAYKPRTGEPSVVVDLELDQAELLSVVDKGASGNGRVSPKIVLIKRKGIGGAMGFISKWFGKDGKLQKADAMAMKSPKELLEGAMDGIPEEKANVIMAAIAALVAEQGGKVEPPEPEPAPAEKQDPEPEKEPEMKPEEVAKALQSMTPEGRALIEKIAADNKAKDAAMSDLQKSVKTLTEKLDGEVSKSLDRESLEKAKKTPHVPGEIEKRAELLREADAKLSPAAAETLAKILGDADAVIAKSKLLGSEGTTGHDGNADADSPVAKAEALAKSRLQEVRKSGNAKLTYEQVLDQVWEENPDLYREYRKRQG